jgi:hypothetical protein
VDNEIKDCSKFLGIHLLRTTTLQEPSPNDKAFMSKESWSHQTRKFANEIKDLDRKPDIFSKINDPSLKLIAEELRESNTNRSAMFRELRAKLFALKNDLIDVKNKLQGKSSKTSDGTVLRFILEEFETKLTRCKAQTKSVLSELDTYSAQIGKEIEETYDSIEIWEEPEIKSHSKALQPTKPVSTKDIVQKTLLHQRRLGAIEKEVKIESYLFFNHASLFCSFLFLVEFTVDGITPTMICS